MIREKEIASLVSLLRKRKVYLYHACQLKDFRSYLALGGVPSRALLQRARAAYTAFDTDASDEANEVWDKVFLNLSDFGLWFALGKDNIPNPYGPILLIIRPKALSTASDIAVCLRSAGAKGFNRDEESLCVEDVDRLFCSPSETQSPESTYIKFAEELRKEFATEKAHTPEISCTYPNGSLALGYISKIVVDPYKIHGNALVFLVQESVNQLSPELKGKVRRRYTESDRRKIYDELGHTIMNGTTSLERIVQSGSGSGTFMDWAKRALEKNLEFQFQRFAQYLHEGTLTLIQS